MAITLDKPAEIVPLTGGQNGCYLVFGTFSWTTTATTGDLPVPFGKIVGGIVFTPLAAPNTDESVHVVGAGLIASGDITVAATGLLPIARVGTATSALKYSYSYLAR